MDDKVIDTTVVAFANDPINDHTSDQVTRCLPVIQEIVNGSFRCRFNTTLINEYEKLTRTQRNDVIEVFIIILDSPGAIRGRNSLRHHENARAQDMMWPRHDRHLLAAAIDGVNPSIVVTENRLAQLHAKAKRVFGVSVQQV